jgi:hypothetical protein
MFKNFQPVTIYSEYETYLLHYKWSTYIIIIA